MDRKKLKEFIWKLPYGDMACSVIGGLTDGFRKPYTNGSCDARYCYSVWLRHLVKSYENGLRKYPAAIAELGPGDSLGTGLAAMLCGVDRYYALDVVVYRNLEGNIPILEELVELIERREPIPHGGKYDKIRPLLQDYAFPHHILTDEILEHSLDKTRVDKIRAVLESGENRDNGIKIEYFAPYDKLDRSTIQVDFILSQAVLEYVDIEKCYLMMDNILEEDGYMSHQIDFSSHGSSKYWNGHWGYSDRIWRLICATRPFFLNRCTLSQHLKCIRENNFEVVQVNKSNRYTDTPAMSYNKLANAFKGMSQEDFETTGVYILAKKKRKHFK